MSMHQQALSNVHALCNAVASLCAEVNAERERYGRELHTQSPDAFSRNYSPSTPAASPKTGELRRRSMDLTRALAELRR